MVTRRERTHRLIELGGLISKAGLVELTDDDRAVMFGMLIEAAARLRTAEREQLLLLWRRRGQRAFADDEYAAFIRATTAAAMRSSCTQPAHPERIMSDTDDNMPSPPIVPLMPTGNGVTDLEIAREQSAVADAEAIIPPEQPPMDNAAGGPQAEDPEAPVDDDRPTLSE